MAVGFLWSIEQGDFDLGSSAIATDEMFHSRGPLRILRFATWRRKKNGEKVSFNFFLLVSISGNEEIVEQYRQENAQARLR